MNAKHTPGPWRIAPPGVYTSGVNIDAFAGGYVALIGGGVSDPVMADARLIAAAPDLLEALETLLASFDSEIHNEYDGTSWLAERLAEADHARAAIAKARGEV